jgi:hypothetical protein
MAHPIISWLKPTAGAAHEKVGVSMREVFVQSGFVRKFATTIFQLNTPPRMKRLLPIAALFICICSASGQTDSTLLRPAVPALSKSELIGRYRNILMDDVIANNTEKTKETFFYMLHYFDDRNYVALYSPEKWAVAYLTGNYNFITTDIVNTDSTLTGARRVAVKPWKDQLYEQLRLKLAMRQDTIRQSIGNSSGLSEKDKGFLLLLMQALLASDNDFESVTNKASAAYLRQYPDSRYDNYVRNVLHHEYDIHGFSMALEFWTGASIMSKTLHEGFGSGAVFGFGFVWGWNNFQLNTRASIVFSRLNADMPVKNYIWQQSERAQVFLPEISLGYVAHVGNKFVISPVAGISWFSAAPFEADEEKNSDLKGIEINSGISPIFGIEIGREFSSYYMNNPQKQSYRRGFYSYHIRYTIQQVAFGSLYNRYNGTTHNISLVIKFGLGGAKRIY